MGVVLSMSGISMSFSEKGKTKEVFSKINLDIPDGSITIISGPNGSGKTTLLKIAGLLLKPLEGEIFWEGYYVNPGDWRKRLEIRRKHIAFSPQEPLFPEIMRISELIKSLPLRQKKALSLMEEFSLFDHAEEFIHTLSGGMRKKLAHIITLSREAKLYILDEPFSHLDERSKNVLLNTISLLAESGKSILIATPDANVIQEKLPSAVYTLENGNLEEKT